MLKYLGIAMKWYSINHDICYNCLIIIMIVFFSLTSRFSRAPLVGLVLLYTIFIGLVLYLILTLSDPFQGIGAQTNSFEHAVEIMRSRIN